MRRVRRGFTLVEVSLFLAITAAVFVGVAVGTQNSIFQQRYNDAVQNFAEFLRGVYSQVTNVQNDGGGRSEQAIYGKLVVFGNENGENLIRSYSVVGKIGEFNSGNILEQLRKLEINTLADAKLEGAAGFVEDYKPRWAAQIQTTGAWDAKGGNTGYQIFEGALLIVRHPSSGTVYTFFSDGNNVYNLAMGGGNALADFNNEYLDEYNAYAGFVDTQDVDFCVNPNGPDRSNLRRDVRIVAGARNASGVEIIGDGVEETQFFVGGPSVNIGNRCE